METFDARRSQGAVGANSGSITQSFGITPDMLPSLLRELLPLFKSQLNVADILPALNTTRQQIRLIAEYKQLHDVLQELELSHGALYDEVSENGLPNEHANWTKILRRAREVGDALLKVIDEANGLSFVADLKDVIDELAQSADEVRAACAARNIQLLDAIINDIYDVMRSAMTSANDQLVGAVRGFLRTNPTDALIMLHAGLRDGLSNDDTNTVRLNVLNAFQMEIQKLDGVIRQLAVQTNIHGRWQKLDDMISVEQTKLHLDHTRLRRMWERTLYRLLRELCEDGHPRSLETLIDAANLQSALEKDKQVDILDAFFCIRSSVRRRFNTVDHELRGLCTQLRDPSALDAALEVLR